MPVRVKLSFGLLVSYYRWKCSFVIVFYLVFWSVFVIKIQLRYFLDYFLKGEYFICIVFIYILKVLRLFRLLSFLSVLKLSLSTFKSIKWNGRLIFMFIERLLILFDCIVIFLCFKHDFVLNFVIFDEDLYLEMVFVYCLVCYFKN